MFWQNIWVMSALDQVLDSVHFTVEQALGKMVLVFVGGQCISGLHPCVFQHPNLEHQTDSPCPCMLRNQV